MEKLPDFNRKTSLLSFEQDNSMKMIHSFSVLGDNCLIYSVKDGKPRLDFHNIPSRKTYLSRPFYGGRTMLINPETFISYQYYNMATETRPFLYAYEMKGDTLCRFMNRNPLIAPNPDRRSYTNPDAGSLYYYDNRITMRQSYSDTVYRMTAPNELTAAYVLDFGSKRADINTALFGDKSDRLIPNNWLETARFIFIIHTRNYDCPANRSNKSVTFYYSCFDKRDGKLYSLPSTAFPENFFLPNDVEGGLPLIMDNARSGEGKLYIGYTKLQLTAILNHQNFASLPAAQQEKTRAACESLNEGEMLVMILE
jgi:hypothetical protein